MTPPDWSPGALFDLADVPWRGLVEGSPEPWGCLGKTLSRWLDENLEPGIEGEIMPGAIVEGRVRLGPGSVVEPGAYVRGPCLVGRDVEIRHGAYVRGTAIVGDGAVIGHATEVKGSIFLPGAKAGHFAYVGDSILGRGVNLGAGTKLANLRLSNDEVCIRTDRGDAVRTGLRKLGAILGDGAQTGCNSVTNPGTILGRGALVHPCAVASGFHPAGSVVRAGRVK